MVCGNTEIGYWSHLAFPTLRPRSFLTSGYFATLGYAFPTALGAKIGNPQKQVVATSGDGGKGVAQGGEITQTSPNSRWLESFIPKAP